MVETVQRGAERLDEENPDRARHWAFAAFVLLFVSLFTAWYVVRHDPHEMPSVHQVHKVAPFEDTIVGEWGPLATGILVSIAMAYLLWGWMAAQWRYEPDKWRRDVWTAFVLAAGSVMSVVVWPPTGGGLWSQFLLAGHDDLSEATLVSPRLGFGWYAALGATLALLVAGIASRHHHPETYEEPVPHGTEAEDSGETEEE